MSIFLSLSDSCLSLAIVCKELSKCIGKLYFMKCNGFVWNGSIVFCETYISYVLSCASVKSVELICTECSGNLSCTVWTEVKEDNGIVILYGCSWSTIFHDYSRNYKLVRYVFCIRCINCCNSAVCCLANTFCNCFICFFYTIPTIVTIHCIVTSVDGCDFTNTDFFHFCFQLFDKSFSGSRCCITAV